MITVNIPELSFLLDNLFLLPIDTVQVEYNASTNNISNSRPDLNEDSGKMNTCIDSVNSPKKDTGVQTGICLEIMMCFKIYLKS